MDTIFEQNGLKIEYSSCLRRFLTTSENKEDATHLTQIFCNCIRTLEKLADNKFEMSNLGAMGESFRENRFLLDWIRSSEFSSIVDCVPTSMMIMALYGVIDCPPNMFKLSTESGTIISNGECSVIELNDFVDYKVFGESSSIVSVARSPDDVGLSDRYRIILRSSTSISRISMNFKITGTTEYKRISGLANLFAIHKHICTIRGLETSLFFQNVLENVNFKESFQRYNFNNLDDDLKNVFTQIFRAPGKHHLDEYVFTNTPIELSRSQDFLDSIQRYMENDNTYHFSVPVLDFRQTTPVALLSSNRYHSNLNQLTGLCRVRQDVSNNLSLYSDESEMIATLYKEIEIKKKISRNEEVNGDTVRLNLLVENCVKDIKEIEQELDLQILTDGNTIQIVFNTPVYPERALLRNGKEVRISCRERVGNELYFNWEKIGIKKITIKSQTEILAYKSDDTLIENHPHVSSAGVLCLGSSFVAKRETIKEFINEFITMYQKINFMSSYHGIYDYVEGETTSLERESYKLPVNMFAA